MIVYGHTDAILKNWGGGYVYLLSKELHTVDFSALTEFAFFPSNCLQLLKEACFTLQGLRSYIVIFAVIFILFVLLIRLRESRE